jgi:hypothetical protein
VPAKTGSRPPHSPVVRVVAPTALGEVHAPQHRSEHHSRHHAGQRLIVAEDHDEHHCTDQREWKQQRENPRLHRSEGYARMGELTSVGRNAGKIAVGSRISRSMPK